jgi:hypothetical protein
MLGVGSSRVQWRLDPAAGRTAAERQQHARWTRFVGRRALQRVDRSTGIDSTNVKTMAPAGAARRTVDASPIYLARRAVNGAAHDVSVVTTTYGKTIAVDANDGSVLWKFTPSGYRFAGSYQVTTATPVADPDRHRVRGVARRQHSQIARRRPRRLDDVDHEIARSREDRLRAQLRPRARHRDDRRLHRRPAAVSGTRRDRWGGQLLHVWNAPLQRRGD